VVKKRNDEGKYRKRYKSDKQLGKNENERI
jgi:hypothetical protein